MRSHHYLYVSRLAAAAAVARSIAAAASAVALSLATVAAAQSGVQITPDGELALVSKDVGNERWAISYRFADGKVTGNVFRSDGGDPQFVYCERIGDDGNPDPRAVEIQLLCSGADRCAAAPCSPDAWVEIATVTLPGSFFLPPAPPPDPAVPTSPDALFEYLRSGAYRSFARESVVHTSSGPHTPGVRTYLNPILDESLRRGMSAHPVGAAAVKELYAADFSTLTGWAVEVKTQPDSSGGQGWYWYEVFSTTNGANPIEGQGHAACTGCHASGADYVRIPYPLQ